MYSTALGIYGLMGTPVKQSFFGAVGDSFVYSGKLGGLVLRSLGELLTGKMGLDSMGGPVTTIKATSEAALSGIWSFLNISGFIGVNLAVFNLLPIPALDGSKVVFSDHRVDSEKADQPQGGGDDSLYRNHFPVRFRHFGGYFATVRIKFLCLSSKIA